ncbi:MAG: hypothetical protein KDJ69_09765 [Nitratireductor sp.]|nr:hypothetical protein [Nitratireductor sp.]
MKRETIQPSAPHTTCFARAVNHDEAEGTQPGRPQQLPATGARQLKTEGEPMAA